MTAGSIWFTPMHARFYGFYVSPSTTTLSKNAPKPLTISENRLLNETKKKKKNGTVVGVDLKRKLTSSGFHCNTIDAFL